MNKMCLKAKILSSEGQFGFYFGQTKINDLWLQTLVSSNFKEKKDKPRSSSSGPTLKCQTCQTAVSPVKARLEFAKSQFLHLHCHPQQSAQKESQPQRPPAQLQLTTTTCFSSRSNEYARGYDYLSVGSSLLGLRDCTAPRFYPL